MDNDLEVRIRERAYELWTQEGRPHGRERDHWDQARRELTTPGGDAVAATEAKRESAVAEQAAGRGRKRAKAPGSTPAEAAATVKTKR
ncbi:DUF2934 domain-containing protein [Alsobacter sp. KACC 23698]|uniref:DUF2934 domain-containing protein n=1 Tax=Alsobacter sp. KACC 23698 TaxID=3149229 RepID=A0AAU7JL66_9HYPH